MVARPSKSLPVMGVCDVALVLSAILVVLGLHAHPALVLAVVAACGTSGRSLGFSRMVASEKRATDYVRKYGIIRMSGYCRATMPPRPILAEMKQTRSGE